MRHAYNAHDRITNLSIHNITCYELEPCLRTPLPIVAKYAVSLGLMLSIDIQFTTLGIIGGCVMN